MLQPVGVMLKGIAGVEGWVNIDALDLTGKVLLEGLQGKEVVALDE